MPAATAMVTTVHGLHERRAKTYAASATSSAIVMYARISS
jgi:hypothetical protein